MPSPFGGEMRKLPYPLDEAVSIEAETPEASGTIVMPDFPEDSDEKISILFRWSLNEWVGMATAIDVGSDIAFGAGAIRAWWNWSMSMVALCEEIIRCIEETEEVRAALAQWFSDAVDNDIVVQQALERAFDPSKTGSPVPEGYANRNQYGAALGCDPNDGWGHIREGLIERSFQRVIEVLEQIESVTNNQEMLAQFLNAIPGVGAFFDVIPVTDWVLWFDNVRAWMKETFEAADTFDLRDQVACDLFCIWQIDCSLSLEQIRRYYWDKTAALVPAWDGAFESMSTLATALGFLSQVDFGEGVVYALVGSQYGFQTFLNDWFGISVDVIGNDLALGEPSDDWEALCDCPELWTRVYDFTIDAQGWTDLAGGTPNYVSGQGWEHAPSPNVGRIQIKLELAAAVDVLSVRFEYTSPTITGDTQTVTLYQAPAYTAVDSDPYSDNVLFSVPFTSDLIAVDTVASSSPLTDPIPGYLFKITVTGEGTPPP